MSDHDDSLGAQGAWLERRDLDLLLRTLQEEGYRCVGPQVRDGGVVFDDLEGIEELPTGYRDRQRPGEYRLEWTDSPRCFDWATGPQALKPLLFAPRETLWRAAKDSSTGTIRFETVVPEAEKVAVIGTRACDLAGLALQDKHFLHRVQDPWYAARRAGLLLVAVECTQPAETCFCASTGDGPAIHGATDLALNELDTGFLVRAYSPAGEAICARLPLTEPTPERAQQARLEVEQAAARQTRALPGRNLRDALFARLDHPRWDEVAQRCLSCGNCVAVCPTCFCHSKSERPALDGGATEHLRQWDTCYSAGHSYMHGRLVRPDTRSRYRQWLTHKLAGWHDQYGRSGCVGCGRCVTWCPVGIDITEEATALCRDAPQTPTSSPEDTNPGGAKR
jgi:ferredoxin